MWGLAYKENTHSTKNSPSLVAISQLQDFRLKVYDPIVSWDPLWHPNAEVLDSPLAALDGVDALMIMTPWPEFKSIAPIDIVRGLKGKIILDPYGLLDRKFFVGIDYMVFTLGSSDNLS